MKFIAEDSVPALDVIQMFNPRVSVCLIEETGEIEITASILNDQLMFASPLEPMIENMVDYADITDDPIHPDQIKAAESAAGVMERMARKLMDCASSIRSNVARTTGHGASS